MHLHVVTPRGLGEHIHGFGRGYSYMYMSIYPRVPTRVDQADPRAHLSQPWTTTDWNVAGACKVWKRERRMYKIKFYRGEIWQDANVPLGMKSKRKPTTPLHWD